MIKESVDQNFSKSTIRKKSSSSTIKSIHSINFNFKTSSNISRTSVQISSRNFLFGVLLFFTIIFSIGYFGIGYIIKFRCVDEKNALGVICPTKVNFSPFEQNMIHLKGLIYTLAFICMLSFFSIIVIIIYFLCKEHDIQEQVRRHSILNPPPFVLEYSTSEKGESSDLAEDTP
jgi:hypothetical protein